MLHIADQVLSSQNTRSNSCRFCGTELSHSFVDLGMSPLCQTHIAAEQLSEMEAFYPLHAYLCGNCFLVQLQEFVAPKDIFGEYAYFSSYSDSWLEHGRCYAAKVTERFGLSGASQVVEVASNDGYLLQHFTGLGVPVLGIEPAANVASAAIQKGIPTVIEFFGRETARQVAAQRGKADLLIGNNVLAHVPDLNDFVAGLKLLLKEDGVITMEFPSLIKLMTLNQFDTIYHEHFSYFSFYTAQKVFAAHGITLFDVEELPTHGGSLRIYGRHDTDLTKPVGARVDDLLRREMQAGVNDLAVYRSFTEKVKDTKRKLLQFLITAKSEGKHIAGYGAPGKGNTLLNYCGIRDDFLDYTVDRNPYKQGKYTPGSHIPIYDPSKIRETKPDYLLILPWNLCDEIREQMSFIREWGGRFVIPIPEVRVLP